MEEIKYTLSSTILPENKTDVISLPFQTTLKKDINVCQITITLAEPSVLRRLILDNAGSYMIEIGALTGDSTDEIIILVPTTAVASGAEIQRRQNLDRKIILEPVTLMKPLSNKDRLSQLTLASSSSNAFAQPHQVKWKEMNARKNITKFFRLDQVTVVKSIIIRCFKFTAFDLHNTSQDSVGIKSLIITRAKK